MIQLPIEYSFRTLADRWFANSELTKIPDGISQDFGVFKAFTSAPREFAEEVRKVRMPTEPISYTDVPVVPVPVTNFFDLVTPGTQLNQVKRSITPNQLRVAKMSVTRSQIDQLYLGSSTKETIAADVVAMNVFNGMIAVLQQEIAGLFAFLDTRRITHTASAVGGATGWINNATVREIPNSTVALMFSRMRHEMDFYGFTSFSNKKPILLMTNEFYNLGKLYDLKSEDTGVRESTLLPFDYTSLFSMPLSAPYAAEALAIAPDTLFYAPYHQEQAGDDSVTDAIRRLYGTDLKLADTDRFQVPLPSALFAKVQNFDAIPKDMVFDVIVRKSQLNSSAGAPPYPEKTFDVLMDIYVSYRSYTFSRSNKNTVANYALLP